MVPVFLARAPIHRHAPSATVHTTAFILLEEKKRKERKKKEKTKKERERNIEKEERGKRDKPIELPLTAPTANLGLELDNAVTKKMASGAGVIIINNY